MLKKRFPELNLGFTDTSNLNGFLEQPATSPDEPYNYEEFFMGSVNNNVRGFFISVGINFCQALQVELVEGVDVEVRVTTIGPCFPEIWVQPFTHPSHSKFSRLEAK